VFPSFSQILSKKQECVIKETIASQFGNVSEHTMLNLGASAFCAVGADTFYNPPGYNYLFCLRGDSLTRLDHSLFHGNNGNRFLFSWKGKLFALGGYGFFTTNNNLLYFNAASKEWCYEPTQGEVPPYILGIAFKSGNLIYSFNNFKCGNNSEADTKDKNVYCLNLDSMSWRRFEPMDQLGWIDGERYNTRDFCFFHGVNVSMLIHSLNRKFVLINNDEYGLSESSLISLVNENKLFFRKRDNNNNQTDLNLDLEQIWLQKKSGADLIRTMRKDNGSIFFSWNAYVVTVGLFGICLIFYFKFGKKEKKFSAEGSESSSLIKENAIEVFSEEPLVRADLLNSILACKKTVLTIDELDELLSITHLESDSRKLRRHRLLTELQTKFPELVTREKDSNDRRRFLYKINSALLRGK
jgi:hypothetical protein